MLCGIYNCSGGPARELNLLTQLPRTNDGFEFARGPLVIAGDTSVSFDQAGGISCILEGKLHSPGNLARELGLPTTTDAGLIARAYDRFGAAVLSRLRGRFSVVLWDESTQHGVLICDLLSMKSVFSWRGAGSLMFASELHDLLSVLPSTPGPDSTAFTMWLGAGPCPQGHTLFDGVSRLGPGDLIDLAPHAVQTRAHWRPRYTGTMKAPRGDLADGLCEQLQRSTANRLSPDATGVILSGGLDSSIVAALAARARPSSARLRTYSAIFPGAEFDESAKVGELTSALEIESGTFQIQPQGALSLALQHTKHSAMPLGGVAALVDVLVLAEAAGDGCDVVLDGQTGDEVLGYSPFVIADRLSRGRLLAALRLIDKWPLGRPPTREQKLRILKHCGVKGAAPYGLGQFVRSHHDWETGGPRWMLPSFRRRFVELDDVWSWKVGDSGPRWWRYLADTLVQLPHREHRIDYLRHRAAATGVVNESPLYDPDVIDYCLKMPPELAFDQSNLNRALAREAMRGIMPDALRLQRQKANFTPFCVDAMEADRAGIDRLITAPDAEVAAYVDTEWIARLWREDQAQPRSDSHIWGSLVWRIVAGEIWLRSLADGAFPDKMLAQADIPRTEIRGVPLPGFSTFLPLA